MSWFVCMISIICLFILIKVRRFKFEMFFKINDCRVEAIFYFDSFVCFSKISAIFVSKKKNSSSEMFTNWNAVSCPATLLHRLRIFSKFTTKFCSKRVSTRNFHQIRHNIFHFFLVRNHFFSKHFQPTWRARCPSEPSATIAAAVLLDRDTAHF